MTDPACHSLTCINCLLSYTVAAVRPVSPSSKHISPFCSVMQVQLSSSNLDTALPHVLLLSSICRDQPGMLNSHIAQLKECLSSFAGLSADAALVLLLALWPLCRVRSDLQDHVIMLLRKMMYRQDVGGRWVLQACFWPRDHVVVV